MRKITAMSCLQAVSYTHLDVYKRQLRGSLHAKRHTGLPGAVFSPFCGNGGSPPPAGQNKGRIRRSPRRAAKPGRGFFLFTLPGQIPQWWGDRSKWCHRSGNRTTRWRRYRCEPFQRQRPDRPLPRWGNYCRAGHHRSVRHLSLIHILD